MGSSVSDDRSASPLRPATRAAYQRALCLLASAWPTLCRVHPFLTSDDFVILAWLLSRQPGRVARQGRREPLYERRRKPSPGIAEELGWGRLKVHRSVARLREAGLVLTVFIADKSQLPTGNKATSHMLRYFVNVATIEAAAAASSGGSSDEPPDGSPDEPSSGSLRSADPTPPNPLPERSRDAERRRRARSPSANRVAGETHREGDASSEGAARPADHASAPTSADEPTLRGKEHERGQLVAALCAQWDALRMRDEGGTVSQCRACERSAVANRLGDYGPELLEQAIVGAGADDWLRSGARRSAFAWVFNPKNLERYADRGRAVLEAERAAAERGAQAAAAEARQERRRAIIARSPWTSSSEPPAFRDSLRRDDLDTAEAMLEHVGGELAHVPAGGAALMRPAGVPPAAVGPAHIAPTLARHFARRLEDAVDRAEAEGVHVRGLQARGAPVRVRGLLEQGANDTEGHDHG